MFQEQNWFHKGGGESCKSSVQKHEPFDLTRDL